MPADHVQAGLRGLMANSVAVAGESKGSLLRILLVDNSDVNQSDGLFRSPPAGAGDSGNSDAESRAGAIADAVCQRESHFRADRALGLNHGLRDADEGSH